MSVPFRLLTVEDAAAAHLLHARCFPAGEAWCSWAFRDTLALRTTLGLATDTGDGLAGMLIVQKTPPEAEILTMCVAPNQRRHGLASALLAGIRPVLGGYGIARLCLDVAADNHGAVSFYEHCGFTVDGRRRNYYLRDGGVRMDAILMSRSFAGHIAESEA